jgi:hypothetical protein
MGSPEQSEEEDNDCGDKECRRRRNKRIWSQDIDKIERKEKVACLVFTTS